MLTDTDRHQDTQTDRRTDTHTDTRRCILPRAEVPRDLDIVRHHCSEYDADEYSIVAVFALIWSEKIVKAGSKMVGSLNVGLCSKVRSGIHLI